MSPELEIFLGAEDLDDLLHARQSISALDAEDVVAIRSIIHEWQNPQAVSNLLFHPTLIPEDLRLASLFRGLSERSIGYYVLAAIVGLQSIDTARVTDEERRRISDKLLEVIRETRGIIAQRASVSIQRFLTEDDAPQIFALWVHPDDTTWYNLRAWLFRTFQTRGTEAFAEAAGQSGLAEETQRRLVGDFAELMTNPSKGFDNGLCPLFGYIPNLRDVGQRDTDDR